MLLDLALPARLDLDDSDDAGLGVYMYCVSMPRRLAILEPACIFSLFRLGEDHYEAFRTLQIPFHLLQVELSLFGSEQGVLAEEDVAAIQTSLEGLKVHPQERRVDV